MSGAGQDWERWQAAIGLQDRARQLAEKHRLLPEMEPAEYLTQKRLELASDLEGTLKV
jgi:hypothetical protein